MFSTILDSPKKLEGSVVSHFKAGNEALKAGKIEDAIDNYKSALPFIDDRREDEIDFWELYKNLATALSEVGRNSM